MALDNENQMALRVARDVLGAAHTMTVTVEGRAVSVEPAPQGSTPPRWPTLPLGRALPGLSEERDGPWPSPCTLRCAWEAGSVELQARLSVFRGRGPQEGQLALEVATQPRNRQLAWTSLSGAEGRVEDPARAFHNLVLAALLKLAGPPPAEEQASPRDQAAFDSLWITNFGPFKELEWARMGRVNVVIGANDTGKSHLLKLLYAQARSVEAFTEHLASPDRPAWGSLLAEKLFWTFEPQSRRLGDLVLRGAARMHAYGVIRNEEYAFTAPATAGQAPSDFEYLTGDARPQPGLKALFLPPREVLTALDVIAAAREQLHIFGFDNTYQDLIRALRAPRVAVELPEGSRRVLQSLEALFEGRFDVVKGRFVLDRGGERFGMSLVAEGIKKIGLLARLLENGQIRPGSVLFLDEPEANLHPRAVRALCRMLYDLGEAGVQIFLATHSYLVLKQLQLLSREAPGFAQLCCLSRSGQEVASSFFDLSEGLPDNELVQASMELYEEDRKATHGA